MSDIGSITLRLDIMGTETQENGYGITVLGVQHEDDHIKESILQSLAEGTFFLDWNKRDLDNIFTIAAQQAVEKNVGETC